MRALLVLPAFAAMLAAPAYAQTAADLLAKVAATYINLTSGHFQGTRVSETKIGSSLSSGQMGFVVAVAKPDKVRVEFDYGPGSVWVRTADGSTFTRYRSATGEFNQQPESPDDLGITDGTFLHRYQRINQDVTDARMAGSDTLQVGGSNVDCYIVEAQYSSVSPMSGLQRLPSRFWIDKNRFVVWREVSGTRSQAGRYATENTTTITFTAADINQQVPPSLFAIDRRGK